MCKVRAKVVWLLTAEMMVGLALAITPGDVQGSLMTPSPEPVIPICVDRHGYLPVERFHHRSCTMCYFYLFQWTKALVANPPGFEWLTARNQSDVSFVAGPIRPDPTNQTTMDMVCTTLTEDECGRWSSCCRAAMACCERQTSTPWSSSRDEAICHRTWDGYSCWDDTKAGTKVYTTCPSFMEKSLQSRSAMKECTVNATWVKNQGLEWTDYTNCLDLESFLVNVYICVGCNSASILLVLPSIIIFIVFRDLTKQHRIRLHINFFLALLMRSVAVILWFMLVHHEKLTNPEADQAVLRQNPVWCRVLSIFKIYLNSTTYSWMFCEGYYLHRLISRAFEPPKTLLTLYVIGWGLPAVPAIIYSVLRVIYNNESCWAFNLGNLEWVLYAPNLFCLVLNIIFLCNILRILLFQLHSHPHEPSSFRRGLKAAFMLIPLFGIQLVLTIYRPNANMEGNLKAYEYTTTIVINSQGVFVSLIFCFFNGEVLAHFHDNCSPCCRRCLRPFVRRRQAPAHVTQMTFVDDRRPSKSPSNSCMSQSSISPRRLCPTYSNGYDPGIHMRDLSANGTDPSPTSVRPPPQQQTTQNGSTPPLVQPTGYTRVPTDTVDP